MKILVIGGTGFLSSAIVEESLAAGHEVTIVTRGRRGLSPHASVRRIVADRTDTVDFKQAVQSESHDLVIDAICFTPAEASQDLDCFAGRAERLVMISTDFVYSVGTRRLPITEDHPRDAPTDYGRNKAAAEDLLLGNGQLPDTTGESTAHGFAPPASGYPPPNSGGRVLGGFEKGETEFDDSILPATVLRPPHILGPGGLLGTGSLHGRDAALPARIRRHEAIVLLDSGALLIQPVDRRDIARACLAVAAAPQCAGRAYNIAGPEAVTTRRYFEIISGLLGMPLKVSCLPSEVYLAAFPGNAPFAQHRAYSLGALARDAAFRPSIPLETTLQETLDWLEQNPPQGADAQCSDRDTKLLALLAERDMLILGLLRPAT